MKKLIVFGAAVLMAGAISAHAADAKEIWEKDCAKCHGADGKGKTKMGEKLGMKDYTDAKVQEEMKDAEMAKAIKEGVKEKGTDKTKMKAFPDLTDADDEPEVPGCCSSRSSRGCIVSIWPRESRSNRAEGFTGDARHAPMGAGLPSL